jgi:hypothetical protein
VGSLKGKVCEICGMVATHVVSDNKGTIHYYDDHHLPQPDGTPLQYNSEIETKLKDYLIFAGIILFITTSAFVYQIYFGAPGIKEYMRAFMGMFFLVFSFFKLINLKGFMMSYVGYDIIARRWFTYGYIYPFIELALATAFLLNFQTSAAYLVDIVVMGLGSIGVIQQLLKDSKIRCACLGSFIKLPLTTISLVEDFTMLGMGLLSFLL